MSRSVRAHITVHTAAGPLVLMGYAAFSGHFGLLPIGLIWTTHIGMDRGTGYDSSTLNALQ